MNDKFESAVAQRDVSAATTVAGRVSVIIPCYNQARYLGACIESVFAQQLDDCEIIVVNDGSSDDTESCARQYGERIVYIGQANAGLSNARNVGVSHARGEFIQFLDSDDLLAPGAIPARLDALRNSGAHIAVCPNRLFSVTDGRRQPQITGQWRLPGGSFDVHLCHANIAPPHAYLLRRDTVLATGRFDETLRACEDYDFILRAVVGGARLVRCDHARVYYRRHPDSMSANLTNQYRHDFILHGRLRELMLVTRTYPQQRLAAKLLAYMAGLALSLTRQMEAGSELAQPLAVYLDEASERLAQCRPERDFHGAYYAALLLRRLRAMRGGAHGASLSAVLARAGAAAGPHRGSVLTVGAADEGVSFYERARYARLRLWR